MTDTDPELPRGIALAWGVAANPQRGPKRELSIERIVEAAMELADGGGLGAVSMSAVAGALGFTTMSLYRYVTAKDDLVLLMQDAAHGVPPETVFEADDWREGVRRWSNAQVDVYRRHPWVLDIPIGGIPATPSSMAWLDAAFAVLASTPLDHDEKTDISLAVMAQSRFQGIVERGYTQAAAAAGSSTDELDRIATAALLQLVTPEAYPELARAIAAGIFADRGGDPFVFGLELLLDGIERYIERRSAGERPAIPSPPPEDPDEVLHDRKVREAQKAVREAEKQLREARKREREARKAARDRLKL